MLSKSLFCELATLHLVKQYHLLSRNGGPSWYECSYLQNGRHIPIAAVQSDEYMQESFTTVVGIKGPINRACMP